MADIEIIRRIAELEDSTDPKSFKGEAGWRPTDVGLWPANVTQMRMEGLVVDGYESNSYHGYRLSDKARALLVDGGPDQAADAQDTEIIIPDDTFEDIIGHDDLKDLLRACLLAERPVHVLLVGPPALAKSLFLWDVERVAGEKAQWLMGSGTSKGGLWDKIAEKQPQIILIDELHTMDSGDTAGLLSIMEGGRIVRTKVGRELQFTIPVRVVAACNRIDGLSPELLSRFAKCRIQAYSREEYLTVVKGVLMHREGTSAEVAEDIARRLDGVTQDVRDAVRVARLAPQLGAEKAIRLLLEGGGRMGRGTRNGS